MNSTLYVTVVAVTIAIVVSAYLISSNSVVVASPNNMMRYQKGSSYTDSHGVQQTPPLSSVQFSSSSSSSSNGGIDEEDVLVVNGFGYISVMPDTLSINIGVDTIAETSRDAVARNSEIVSSVLDALKALGLEEKKEVRTSYFSIYPQYNYPEDGTPVIVGYQASNTISILTKKVDRAAEIIDRAVSAGANRVDGPWYSTSLEAQKQYREQVIGMAMKDAEENAKAVVAMQEGLSIKGIKSITINFNGQPIAFMGKFREGALGSAGMVALPSYYPPVMPGEQQITATVTVVYEIGR
ncbi:MAG: SIMPL domain-containing protein [Candidatus Nitrosocaldus sp.]|nr:SIMPL domain-containing protein [Candidatus Nitrosocaldus sp.]MDW8000860.1 SIMPL domain-containing protein [Candidatus Nitrosocaldus sp.]